MPYPESKLAPESPFVMGWALMFQWGLKPISLSVQCVRSYVAPNPAMPMFEPVMPIFEPT